MESNKYHEQPMAMMHQVEMTAKQHQQWLIQQRNQSSRTAAAVAAKSTGTSGSMNPTVKRRPSDKSGSILLLKYNPNQNTP